MSGLDWRRAKTFREYEDAKEAPAYRDRLDRRARNIERAWLNGLKPKDAAALSGKTVEEIKQIRTARKKRNRAS